MKVFTSALLLAMLASSYAYSYIIPASAKHPGTCYYNGRYLPRGDNQMPTACQNIRCNEDGSILIQGCGRLHDSQCTLLDPTSLTKQYPQCCEMSYRCVDEYGNAYNKQWNYLTQIQADESGEAVQGLYAKNRMNRDVDAKEYEKLIKKERKHVKKLIKDQDTGSVYVPLSYEYQYQPDQVRVNRVQGQDYVRGYGNQDIVGSMGQVRYGKQIQDRYLQNGGQDYVNGENWIGYGYQKNKMQGALNEYGREGYTIQGNEDQADLSGYGYHGRSVLGGLSGYGRENYAGLSGYNREGYANQNRRIQDDLNVYNREKDQDYLNGYRREGYANQESKALGGLIGYRHKGYAGQEDLSGYNREGYVNQQSYLGDRYMNQGRNILTGLNAYNRERDYKDQGYLSDYTGGVEIIYTNKAIRDQDDVRGYGYTPEDIIGSDAAYGNQQNKDDYDVRGYKNYNRASRVFDFNVGGY